MVGVADGAAQGVALRVQSGETVVEFPASSLEAVSVSGTMAVAEAARETQKESSGVEKQSASRESARADVP